MDINFEQTSMTHKKISSFDRSFNGDIQIFSVNRLLLHSVYCFLPTGEKVKFFFVEVHSGT